MISPCHKILQFILFFLKLDLVDFFLIDEFIALDAEQVEFFYFILKHKLKFLDVRFIEFVTLKSFFLEEIDFNLETVVDLS